MHLLIYGLMLWGAAIPFHALETWKAGAAKVKITPEKLMWLSGYGSRKAPAEGTQQELWAKALALEDPQGKRAVILTMDLVGISRDISQLVCAELKQKHDLPRESIILSVSHTHCGPVVGTNLSAMYFLDEVQRKLVVEYAEALPRKLVEVASAALAQLAPVDLSWGNGHVTLAVNRRNNTEKDVPALRTAGKLKGPVDHDVPVLAVRNKEGQVRAVLFGYACHATVLDFQRFCGDYPGYAQAALEEKYSGAIALFWAGCGADQNPLPRRKVELADRYGRMLADGVAAVLDAPMTPLQESLRTTFAEIPLPFSDLPSRDQLVKDSTDANRYVASRAKLLLAEMEKNGSLRGTYPYPIQTWALGSEVNFVTLGGEVVVDYSLRLKKLLSPKTTWVAGYCNDVMAYIPSLRVLKEGGYEGGGAMIYYGLPTVWAPRVEELIVEAVAAQVRKLRR